MIRTSIKKFSTFLLLLFPITLFAKVNTISELQLVPYQKLTTSAARSIDFLTWEISLFWQ